MNGYHADVKNIPATKVTEEDITKTVTYASNGVFGTPGIGVPSGSTGIMPASLS